MISSIVLGLLLVFRTNTAYDRYWEGRKCWGSLINNVRNLARQIWINIEESVIEDRQKKISNMRLLVAFPVANHLVRKLQFPPQALFLLPLFSFVNFYFYVFCWDSF